MSPPADAAAAAEGAGGPRGRRLLLLLLPPVAAALGGAALGAAAAAAALLGLGLPRAPPAPQGATAAHVLLSAGSLAVPSRLAWRYEEGISGVFVSGDVQRAPRGLRVGAGGLYLLYGQFALVCTAAACPAGRVTLQVLREGSSSARPLLAARLDLPPGPGPARSELAQAVGRLRAGDVLELRVDGDVARDSWQLAQDEREGNFVGMMRIAAE